MAVNPRTSIASRNLSLNAAFDVLNAGFLRGYDSTQPTDADTALGAQVLLYECNLSATAFAAASAASKSANSITADSSANATGTNNWGTLVKSDASTRVFDFSAATSSANLIMNSIAISAGAQVSISSFVLSQAA